MDSAARPSEAAVERRGTQTWTWASTNEVQARLLDAGVTVFREEGYRQASVARIVAEAGSSTGSLYHHFGGKAELFVALWREYYAGRVNQVRTAARLARANGEDDNLELFCVGARAYLAWTWERREMAKVFLSDDGPPGFQELTRESWSEWVQRNAGVLNVESKIEHRVTIAVLNNIISQASRETATCKTKRQALELADVMERMIRRVWPPERD